MTSILPHRPSRLNTHVVPWLYLALVILLFVLWRVLHWPLPHAAESCFLIGMLFFSSINVIGALTVAWSSPFLVARISRLVGVILYIVIRFVLHEGFWHALIVWAALWIVASFVIRRARQRAIHATPVPVSRLPS